MANIQTYGGNDKTKSVSWGIVLVVAAAIVAFAAVTIGITATPVYAPGPSACPDPGQCTCNAASGVMTDHAMKPPFNRINNGCTESGSF
jgi:Na+/H+-dicarboxylate symporter